MSNGASMAMPIEFDSVRVVRLAKEGEDHEGKKFVVPKTSAETNGEIEVLETAGYKFLTVVGDSLLFAHKRMEPRVMIPRPHVLRS